jgi:serine/threonine-protein kinase
VTGKPPYEGKSPISLIAKILHAEAQPPDALNADVPAGVSAMVMQLLAKDPEKRIQSASALAELLAGFA